MHVIGAGGDTWGVPGPVFLGGYAVAIVGVGAFSYLLRKMLTGRQSTARDLQPYEAAYLQAGRRRAVAASLAALRAGGAIEAAGRGQMRARPSPPMTFTPLELAVYAAMSPGPALFMTLSIMPGVRRAVNDIRNGLRRDGLLYDVRERLLLRMTGLPLLALAMLGALRIQAGAQNHKPVAYLGVLVVVALIAGGFLVYGSKRSRAGDRALEEARTRNRALDPAGAPAWATHGPAGAAFGVALFGAAAFVSLDPAFAAEIDIERHLRIAAPSSSDGG